MLFRNGDAFLPVNGAGVWSSLESIKPLLEGKRIPEEVRREQLGRTPGSLAKLYQALKSAGMLYESSDDDGHHLSEASTARFRPEIASVELKSDYPLRAFAQIRNKRFVIAGRSDLAFAITAAALESGLCNLSLLCPDWTGKDNDVLQGIVQDQSVEQEGPAVSAVVWEPALRQIPDCDGFMVAVALARLYRVKPAIEAVVMESDRTTG